MVRIPAREKKKKPDQVSTNTTDSEKKHKVTFIELGSVRCIPCQQMQPVMKSIEAKYGKEVKVDFHDVWTDAGKPYGVKYGIEAIQPRFFLTKLVRNITGMLDIFLRKS